MLRHPRSEGEHYSERGPKLFQLGDGWVQRHHSIVVWEQEIWWRMHYDFKKDWNWQDKYSNILLVHKILMGDPKWVVIWH